MALHHLRVVIFGSWATDWMQALDPSSDLWENHPLVKEVLVIPNEHLPSIPPAIHPNLRTVILPLMEWHICMCPKNDAALVAPEATIRTFFNKARFHQYMYQLGLSHLVPKCYKSLQEITYPMILKRVNLNAGLGIALIQSASELAAISQQEVWLHQTVLLQEYIPGDRDYVSHLICKNGEILWHSSLEYTLMDSQAIRGPHNLKTMRRAVLSEDILLQFKYCLEPLKFSGPCNIDLKISPQGQLKILEINPRLGGSLMYPENRDLLKEAINHLLKAAIDQHSNWTA